MKGSPLNPWMQVHSALWLELLQTAFVPHFVALHASIQFPSWQISEYGQSSFTVHWGLTWTGNKVWNINKNQSSKFEKCKIWTFHLVSHIPCVQIPLPPNTDPSGQIHATDLDGWESITTHFWELLQGLLTTQGFWHVWEMHASLEGQSGSTLHSGCSVTTAKIKELIIRAGCKFDSKYGKRMEAFLRSAHSTKPSPFSGGLHSHLSWWLTAVHRAPGAQGFFWHNGKHSFLCDPGGKSQIWFVAQSWWLVHLTSMHDTWGLPCRPAGQ